MANIQEVTEQNFEEEVLKSGQLTIADFWAPWCGYCVKLTPVIEELAKEMQDVKFVKINTDECMNIARNYSINGLPCILIFKDGVPHDRLVGTIPKTKIIEGIRKHL